ncbi:MAG: CRISPR-associated endonuclease Cas1 [Acidimicrobiales bacterium]
MTDLGHTTAPDLVPARMLNELTYCPRLFWIEWVENRFADNDDTVEGRWHHRRVDEGSERSFDVDDEPPKVARSVMLSSQEYGIVAKVDVMERVGDAVVPVETKRGVPPDNEHSSWEPERVQVCAQGLVLREAGYRCDEGVLYFAGARRRVKVAFGDELLGRTKSLLRELRDVAEGDAAPAPLVDSKKCPRCSLVGLCLPDEVNLLARRSGRKPRRLIPRDDDARPLYVTEQGAWVGTRGGRVEITKNKQKLESVRLLDVSQLSVFGNVQVSTQLLRRLMAEEIPVCFFSYGGWFSGIVEGLPSKHVELRRQQVLRTIDGALPVARAIVEGKIRNSRTLLRRNARNDVKLEVGRLKAAAEAASRAADVGELLGIEGSAARTYFSRFADMIRSGPALPGQPFSFEGRNRRPPRDAINCLLSYLYALLVKDCTATLFAVGLDPYVGFYHRARFGRPAAALDLAEEFRPLIADSTVVRLVNNGEVDKADFVVRAGGVALTQAGRKTVVRAYERRLAQELRHPTFGYRASYRRILEVQARLLGAHLLGEIEQYVPVVTR